MNGTDEIPDRSTNRKRDHHSDDQTPNLNLNNPALTPAYELGKQLAKGVAFSTGKHLANTALSDIEHNPNDNFFTHLLDWIQSL